MKDSFCAICSGKLRIQKVTIDRIVGGHVYLFEKVPAEVCDQCGEIWIPGSEAERMERAIQGKIKPRKEVAVPVYVLGG